VTMPVTYVELNSPDLEATAGFLAEVFGWQLQPFAAPDYLVAPHGDGAGVDTGVMPSRDGQPRAIPVIRVDDLEGAMTRLGAAGGKVVVEPFAVEGVGRGCYFVDPSGLLFGLHCYEEADG